ncbi:3-isopropylmalate dehydrogenase [Friedmanniomyces endolithicus]|nr:3-isopropylmalate dehydrogenase [Friedmanniomyces endolithicus]
MQSTLMVSGFLANAFLHHSRLRRRPLRPRSNRRSRQNPLHHPTHAKDNINFTFQHHLLGGASIDATGSPLTDDALDAAKAADAVLLGAIGGPKWGTGTVRPEQGLLRLRKEMGTFGNLRPCFFASETLVEQSPLKAEVCRGVNFNIVRELTGGIYFGERTEDDGSGYAMDTEPYSRMEIERVTRLAGFLALAEEPPAPVWSLDKANVMATSRLWRKTVTEVMAREFPQLKVGHHLIDSAAMLMVKNPRALNGVIVTSNLFGDIISDEASVIPGSLGLLPSASLTASPDGKGKCNGIYEPIHGSAPDISGKGIVNPVAMILSVGMMLKYSLQQPALAKKVDEAVKVVIDKGIRTADIGGSAKTSEVGDAVAKELETILKRA